jgi:membrane protein involved in colicin uptake
MEVTGGTGNKELVVIDSQKIFKQFFKIQSQINQSEANFT